MNEIIKTIGLTKRYREQISVNNLNMTVRRGEIYGFIGRNGAGKTTTIRMLLGLIKPSNGKIEIFGEDFFQNRTEILRKIGSIVEIPGFYENLTAKENLFVNARILNIHRTNAIDEVLEIVGLHQETKKLVGKYSLGMKQRLGIARALLHNPELLILDEPTNGLDPIGIKEMRKLIQQLSKERNITVLISSHILSEMEQLVTHVGMIHKGNLLEETSLEVLQEKNRKYVEFQVTDAKKAVRLLQKEMNITKYELENNEMIRLYSHIEDRIEINHMLTKHNIGVSKILVAEDPLETYFTNLVGGGTIG